MADVTRENLEIARDMGLSQECRAAAHAALEKDADLESLINNLFSRLNASDMADCWKDFLSMTDALMQKCAFNPYLQLGRVCQFFTCHAAMDGSI